MYQTILSEIRKSILPLELGSDVWKIIYSFIYNKHPCSIMIKGFFENVDKIYHSNNSYYYDEIKNGNMLDSSHIEDLLDMDNSKVINMMIEIIYFDMHRHSDHYIEDPKEQNQFVKYIGDGNGKYYRYDLNKYTSKLSELYRQMNTENGRLVASSRRGFINTKWEYSFDSKIDYHNYLEKIRQQIRNYGFNTNGMLNITIKTITDEYKIMTYEDWKKEDKNMEHFLKMNSNYEKFINQHKNVSKIYCNCPFKNKDDIKKLGFKWDADNKKWYIVNSDLTSEVLFEASKFVKF